LTGLVRYTSTPTGMLFNIEIPSGAEKVSTDHQLQYAMLSAMNGVFYSQLDTVFR